MILLLTQATPAITWIKVEKPSFDLIGLILGSVAVSVLLAVTALALGAAVGYALIRRNRRQNDEHWGEITIRLHLDTP